MERSLNGEGWVEVSSDRKLSEFVKSSVYLYMRIFVDNSDDFSTFEQLNV